MLSVKLINEQATLNNFFYPSKKEYTPSEAFTIKFQIFDSETTQRYMGKSASVMEVVFQKADGTELTKTASYLFNPDDKSMFSVALTAQESEDIIGSNFKVVLDVNGDDSEIKTGMAYNLVSKIVFDGDC